MGPVFAISSPVPTDHDATMTKEDAEHAHGAPADVPNEAAAVRVRGRRAKRDGETLSKRAAEADRVMIEAALELIVEGGSAAVSVRSLAQRTHYSPSAVGYHTSPFDDFLAAVWRRIGSELANEVYRPADGDRRTCAARMLDWAEASRERTSFFLETTPRRPPSTNPMFWTFLRDAPREPVPPEPTMALLHYLSRRLQAALEYALSADSSHGRHEKLEFELALLSTSWRRHVSTIADTTHTP